MIINVGKVNSDFRVHTWVTVVLSSSQTIVEFLASVEEPEERYPIESPGIVRFDGIRTQEPPERLRGVEDSDVTHKVCPHPARRAQSDPE